MRVDEAKPNPTADLAPKIELPRGGGALRRIGEKFQANAFTGTGTLSIPLAVSPGQSGSGPSLSLAYSSGGGSGPFGLGFTLSVPSISRKTDKGLPAYRDAVESDVFVLTGAEDLVPAFAASGWGIDWGTAWGTRTLDDPDVTDQGTHYAFRYRPRVEGGFARIREVGGEDHRRDPLAHARGTT